MPRKIVFANPQQDEWLAAAWLAVVSKKRHCKPIYIKGNAALSRYKPLKTGGVVTEWINSSVQLCVWNEAVRQFEVYIVKDLYWHDKYFSMQSMFQRPYGTPLYELLRGTLKSAEYTALTICQCKGSWVYGLQPGIRNIRIANKKDGITRILTHKQALRIAGV